MTCIRTEMAAYRDGHGSYRWQRAEARTPVAYNRGLPVRPARSSAWSLTAVCKGNPVDASVPLPGRGL
jgi:hypothetical protein